MTSDEKIELLRKMKEEASQGGGPERIARQRVKGKKKARERALEGLMVDLLTDMLVLFETDGMLASHVEVDVTTVEDQWRAVAMVRGEPYDGDRHELLHDIKAVTYHTLEVRPDEGWARVLFDI